MLSLVSLIVSDYDEAIEFFVDVLGFELIEDSPSKTNDGRPKRWVVVRPPGRETGLLLARADGERQKAAVGDQMAGRVGFFLTVDDFDASYRRMVAAGVEFIATPRDEPYGRLAIFRDIAGNRWDLLGTLTTSSSKPEHPGRIRPLKLANVPISAVVPWRAHMHGIGYQTRRRSGRALLLCFAVFAALLSSIVGVSPASASGRSSGGIGPRQVDFDITSYQCETNTIKVRTRPDGSTIVRAVESGSTQASIALMTGTISVRTKTVLLPDGSGSISASWTLEPDGSTGNIRGKLAGSIHTNGNANIQAVGYGRGSLRKTRIDMTGSANVSNDKPSCDDGAETTFDFEISGAVKAPADPAPVGAVVVESSQDFAETVADLTATINANPNLGLVATVDHQAAAASRDLILAPTTELFFGNPNIGTPLMQAAQQTGIDLPQKMLIWEDLLGTVRVAYNAPAYLQSRHGIEGPDAQLAAVANALAGLASAATGTTVEPTFDAGQVDLGAGLVTVTSDRSADEAFAAILAALEAAPPVNVAFTLEHDANAARVGLTLRPTKLVVFGNPSLGTSLMQTDQSSAIDLPQKILVYENEAGETVIAYNDPRAVARRHGLGQKNPVLDILAGALANFANAGS